MAERIEDYASLLDAIKARIGTRQHRPLLVAIAGPPASGKSTLAENLTNDLCASGHHAAYCPMDGFHKYNAQLDSEGLRDFKGRIDTFDAAAFVQAVVRLLSGEAFWWPGYSRRTDEPVPRGSRIEGIEAVYIIEGNYLLINIAPWNQAAEKFDLRVFIDAPDSLLMERLSERHLRGGKNSVETQAHIMRTDMPNGKKVRESATLADILFQGAGRCS